MQKSKKHLDKIYLKKSAYKIENKEVSQVLQPIEKPFSLMNGLSNMVSGQVYEVVFKNIVTKSFISYG